MNGADDDEITAAINDELRGEVALALAGVEHDLAPPSDDDVFANVTAIAALICGDWTVLAKDEFIHFVASECMEMPGSLVIDSLKRARRKVTLGRVLLSWISDDVEPFAAKLKVERDRLTKLTALAAG